MSGKKDRVVLRIQLDLPEEKVKELDALMEETGISTRKDLLNTALTFLAWITKERKENRIIVSLDEQTGSYKELVMPHFSALPKTSGPSAKPRNPA
jgi:metal-responsive CopG/Arc/MetJ family transcriptional regulator